MEQGKAPSPEWLLPLLESKFFEQCERHLNQRKNEINRFCMECADSLCPNCVTEHFRKGEKHHFLQIRHYVHSDVVRVDDITKLLDITKIQQYIANGAKVVHLNPKTSKANPEGVTKSYIGGTPCTICTRAISKPNLFCSIACKRFDDYDKEVLFNLEATGDDWDKPETGVKRCFTGKEESSSGTEKSDANCSFVTSHRKNNRKATPVRSPFN
ncbi:PLATZ transcription factor family protein [Rhynchospora pubera]|uniref:PLATZ transcription factor family protein n=1 Tax=Rhynchospora pubera TaxID=906938 RepID=A0AAV8HXT5_9POAL|nr:PLATZ transcription factor family protein [Rhynchospora pubera]